VVCHHTRESLATVMADIMADDHVTGTSAEDSLAEVSGPDTLHAQRFDTPNTRHEGRILGFDGSASGTKVDHGEQCS